jgi:hypothetical protein
MANVPTTVTVEYTMTGGTNQSVDLGVVPASSSWSIASFTFTPPAGVKTMSVYHKIANV